MTYTKMHCCNQPKNYQLAIQKQNKGIKNNKKNIFNKNGKICRDV